MPRPACSFKLRLDLSSVRVQADAARLQQVVINLLSNAAKFMPEGGTASVSLTREGDEAVVVVSDSGVGMAPTLLGRIFEPFERGPRTDANGLGWGCTWSDASSTCTRAPCRHRAPAKAWAAPWCSPPDRRAEGGADDRSEVTTINIMSI